MQKNRVGHHRKSLSSFVADTQLDLCFALYKKNSKRFADPPDPPGPGSLLSPLSIFLCMNKKGENIKIKRTAFV